MVVRSHGLFHDVQTDEGLIQCTARGRLKRRDTGGIVVGDRVTIDAEQAVIDEIEPRLKVLERGAILRGRGDQLILANATRLLAVFAAARPDPNLRMLDRFLVLAHAHELEAIVCLNKVDLDSDGSVREVFGLYERIGYRVLHTCAKTGLGLDDLASTLSGHISVLAGPSGVGKTSMLNRMAGTTLVTAEISEATGKGRHTTRGATLLPVAGGYVADTAGIRALALAGVDREDLDLHFLEFEPYLGKCRFVDCTHESEPDCAVSSAPDIDPRRLDSYRRLRANFDAD